MKKIIATAIDIFISFFVCGYLIGLATGPNNRKWLYAYWHTVTHTHCRNDSILHFTEEKTRQNA
jgi:hypothetical protein